jgi:methylmalonyl-CoA mutase
MKFQLEDFPEIPTEQWKKQIAKELKKANSPESFEFVDKVENLTFSITPENFPTILIENDKKTSDWKVGYEITITDINSKEANKEALQALNFGANAITFSFETENTVDLNLLLEGIGIEYIDLHFNIKNEEQGNQIVAFKKVDKHKRIFINSEKGCDKSLFISSYNVHSIGGNATEELAYLLAKINQKITEFDFKSIHIEMGIGNNLLLEISKFKAARILINQLFRSYNLKPEVYITAKTGFVNKSYKDPHTNLLRQTTEVLSAVLGNADQIIALPYDKMFVKQENNFTARMAINISNLLKEEGKIHLNINPFSGSRYINQYIHVLSDAAWNLLNEIEKNLGIENENGLKIIQESIVKTRERRIIQFKSKEQLFVGINAFLNPTEIENEWNIKMMNTFLELPPLILEQEIY